MPNMPNGLAVRCADESCSSAFETVPMRRQYTRDRARGFTLIELLVTIAIILTIAAIAIPNFMQALRQARIARAVGDIRAIANDIQAYDVTYDKYPDTLDDIGRSDTKDPWGT